MGSAQAKHYFNQIVMIDCIKYFNDNRIYASTRRVKYCYESKGRVNYYKILKELEVQRKIERRLGFGWILK